MLSDHCLSIFRPLCSMPMLSVYCLSTYRACPSTCEHYLSYVSNAKNVHLSITIVCSLSCYLSPVCLPINVVHPLYVYCLSNLRSLCSMPILFSHFLSLLRPMFNPNMVYLLCLSILRSVFNANVVFHCLSILRPMFNANIVCPSINAIYSLSVHPQTCVFNANVVYPLSLYPQSYVQCQY